MNINKNNSDATLKISIDTASNMLGNDDPQFQRIHHHFHHIALYVKDYIMKDNCKNYLEIGTHYGHSLCNILQSKYNSKIASIDIFKRWSDGNIEDMEELANANANLFNTKNYNFKIIKGDSKEINTMAQVKAYLNGGIDLIFIDGDHSSSGVKSDFDNYFPIVNSGGYIILDDYMKNSGVESAVALILKEYRDELIDIGLVDDLSDVYKLKGNTPHMFDGKNMSYIIKKK